MLTMGCHRLTSKTVSDPFARACFGRSGQGPRAPYFIPYVYQRTDSYYDR